MRALLFIASALLLIAKGVDVHVQNHLRAGGPATRAGGTPERASGVELQQVEPDAATAMAGSAAKGSAAETASTTLPVSPSPILGTGLVQLPAKGPPDEKAGIQHGTPGDKAAAKTMMKSPAGRSMNEEAGAQQKEAADSMAAVNVKDPGSLTDKKGNQRPGTVGTGTLAQAPESTGVSQSELLNSEILQKESHADSLVDSTAAETAEARFQSVFSESLDSLRRELRLALIRVGFRQGPQNTREQILLMKKFESIWRNMVDEFAQTDSDYPTPDVRFQPDEIMENVVPDFCTFLSLKLSVLKKDQEHLTANSASSGTSHRDTSSSSHTGSSGGVSGADDLQHNWEQLATLMQSAFDLLSCESHTVGKNNGMSVSISGSTMGKSVITGGSYSVHPK